MENRRQHYRQAIPPARALKVWLRSSDGARAIPGNMLDLSIGGFRMRADASASLLDKTWIATFALESRGTLSIPVEPVHVRQDPPQHGFRFLPRVSPRAQEDLERTIWSYLLDEQRAERREA